MAPFRISPRGLRRRSRRSNCRLGHPSEDGSWTLFEQPEISGTVLKTIMVPESAYVILSAVLFTIGVVGVLVRRNPLVIFMSIELMLNAANLALVAFGQRHGTSDGQVLVFFVMTVAAAEVAVGLAIIVSIFRQSRRLSIDDLNLMRW